MVDQALAQLSPTFDRMYASNGRASIPPEHLRKACLLMALFSVRSERQFCERREYDRLFKWFLDPTVDELPGGMTTARSPKPAVNGGPYHQAPSFAVARSAKSRKPRAPKKVKQKAWGDAPIEGGRAD